MEIKGNAMWTRLNKFYVEVIDGDTKLIYLEDDKEGVEIVLNDNGDKQPTITLVTNNHKEVEMTLEGLGDMVNLWYRWNNNPHELVDEFVHDNDSEPPVPDWF